MTDTRQAPPADETGAMRGVAHALAGRRVVVLGASGLIGAALVAALAARGASVTAVARRFAPQQGFEGSPRGAEPVRRVEAPFVDHDVAELRNLLQGARPDVVVNATGALGAGGDGAAADVHEGLVARLLAALEGWSEARLVHVSVPGSPDGDATAFSRTKRVADFRIAQSGRPHVVLRPGFVVAPTGFGGSALVRALAASPFALPRPERDRPFRAVAMEDLAETVCRLVARPTDASAVWDVMHPEPLTLGEVVDAFRAWLGAPPARLALPRPLLDLGAKAGDLAVRLGWRPPVRSATLAELRRGVEGDPSAWMAATGLMPRTLRETLAAHPAGVQERWFARLYLLKPLWLVTLVAFWVVSGAIALLVSYDEARAILLRAGFPGGLAHLVTVTSSLTDIVVGLVIAHRRTCRVGLWAGIGVSLFYMAGAAVLTPAMWVEPLGALVKTFPALVLMLVALATLEDR